MIDLSIIIVNYNVKPFVLQCLDSIGKSQLANYQIETIVVDNQSSDGSVEAVRDMFPAVTVIANDDNPGFAKANNQGMAIAQGRYTLLLNPDTVIAEDTLRKCLDYIYAHKDIGALGVKMIDGAGTFLPESKRGLPTPWNSLMKLTGLSGLFPKSQFFGGYNLSYLSPDETHEIDVLCGAFMLMPTDLFRKLNGLDESFFMYGEDIDLSYRIQKAGYKVMYFPETTIIHYKGESTKKSSLNYVKTFYNAMIIYVKKHFAGALASLFVMVLSMAIYVRAGISIVRRIWDRIWQPLMDGACIFAGLLGVKSLWATYYFGDSDYFVNSNSTYNLAIYAAIWIVCLMLYGHYSKSSSLKTLGRGMFIGTAIILIGYALLPTEMRSSRALILLGMLSSAIILLMSSLLRNKWLTGQWSLTSERVRKVTLVSTAEQESKITTILKNAAPQNSYTQLTRTPNWQSQLAMHNPDQLVLDAQSMSYGDIISFIAQEGSHYTYKICASTEIGVIGSDDKDQSGEYFTKESQYLLAEPRVKAQKRRFDIISSCLLLLFTPIILIINRLRWSSIVHCWKVLRGQLTWVSYIPTDKDSLPKTQPAVISLDSNISIPLTEGQQADINQQYARKYDTWRDQLVLLRNLHRLHIRY